MLLRETGCSLIEHTYRSAKSSRLTQEVIVATDSEEIFTEVESFGGKVVMTDPNHICGTDRVAEVAASLTDTDFIINVQGDEPEICSSAIDKAITTLADDVQTPMSTLATPITEQALLTDPNCVKVVLDERNKALLFSRSQIPFPRNPNDFYYCGDASVSEQGDFVFLQHLGVYGYRREFLLKIPDLKKCPLEQIESLEQLRILYHGHSIKVGLVPSSAPGIDTLEDYQAFVSRTTN